MARLPVWGVGVIALLIVLGLASASYYPLGGRQSSTSSSSATEATVTLLGIGGGTTILSNELQGGSPGSWLLDSPNFVGNSLKIDYPPDYLALVNFTLGVINADRASSGLPPVKLSAVPSGQQHADSMGYYGYFSHWDDQGYKPYMRYTLLGGTGAVDENLALNYCGAASTGAAAAPAPCTVQTIENAINASEWSMMNNDTQCCADGHRDNILGPIHNRVSIGVAYNSTTVYLVEDFEDDYITSGSLQLSAGMVTFNGTLPQEPWAWMNRTAGAEIAVFYDPTPTGISPSELAFTRSCSQYSELNESAACQYQGAYNPGTAISTVLTPCPPRECGGGNFTYAETWQYVSGNFDIVFSMNDLVSAHGDGVYTFYLWPAELAPEPITSLSVFVTGD